MANPFLTDTHEEIETAIMLEKAYVTDIGNAVAYADSKDRIFINTEENLYSILPNYCVGMLKWLLWHERYHVELKHHNRFYKYIDELSKSEVEEEFQVTKEEVNIIMDILVHDSLSKMFPELVEIAKSNMAQMRNSNSLKYTFKTFTLEEMLEEYRKHKNHEDEEKDKEKDEETEDEETEDTDETKDTKEKKEEPKEGDKKKKETKEKRKETHGEGAHDDHHETPEDTEDTKDEVEEPKDEELEPMHDDRDWSKLDDIDDKEFIDDYEGDTYIRQIEELKNKKIRECKLTQKLNGLATAVKQRTYAMPSTIRVGKGIILKGRKPAKTELYIIFDASGSMGRQLETFKHIIGKSIPQAMNCPCEWFSGYGGGEKARACRYDKVYRGHTYRDYFKGKFKDIMGVEADDGYGDDGDRVIELCWLAEQAGYTPIGVTDGGGGIKHEETIQKLKQLRRTIIASQDRGWIAQIKEYNPGIQTLKL